MKHFFSDSRLFGFVTGVCILALFANCDMPAGLGTEIDLQNPEINIKKITTPEGAVVWESGVTTIKLPQKSSVFILEGEWSDNVEVRKLQVSDDSTSQVYGSGSISKNASGSLGSSGTWKSQIDLQGRSGDVPLRVTAYDFSGNSGMAQVTILVDLTPPMVIGTDLIRHSGLMPYTTLKSESLLENVSRENVADIDNLQNEFFVIQATMDEKILSDKGVDEALLNIHAPGKEEPVLSGLRPFTVPPSLPNEDFSLLGKNLKKPWWCVDHAMLEALGIGLEQGRHKLRFSITAKDDAVNVGTSELEWLIWEKESDKPRARALNVIEDRIILQEGDKLELTVFDDDNLGQVYAKVFKDADARNALFQGSHDPATAPDLWLAELLDNIETVITKMNTAIDADIAAEDPDMDESAPRPWAREEFSGDSRTRQQTYRLDPGGEGDLHYLVVLVKDKKDDKDRIFADAWSAIMYPVAVSDKDDPIIIIQSPNENTVPAVPENASGGKPEFTIEGFTLDNVGAAAARIAWIPVALRGGQTEAQLIEEAKEALGRTTITDGAVVGDHGIKMWNFPFTGISDDYVGYIRRYVAKTFNIITDFTYDGGAGVTKIENEPKLFVLYTSDGANKVYSTFRMAKYAKIPLITASQSVHNEVNENTASVIVTFSASSAAAGVQMDESSYRVTVEGESSPDLESLGGGEYRAKISGNMGDIKTFTISVQDELGLLAEERKQIRLTRLPRLLNVTSTLAGASRDGGGGGGGKNPYGAGQIISVQAHFDLAVAVLDLDGSDSTNPYIALGNFTDGISRTAAYKTGSGGTTLTFEYMVAENDSTEHADGSRFQGITTALTPISVPAGARIIAASDVAEADWVGDAIMTLGSEQETLQGSKTLVVDGIKPVFKTIKFDDPTKPGTGADYFKEGDTVLITVEASEPLFVSASPDLHIKIKDGADLNAASFSQVNQYTMEFSYLVQDNAPNGRLDFKPYTAPSSGAFISETHAAYIKDEAGNALDWKVNPVLLEEAYIDTVVGDPVIRLSSNGALPEGESYYNTSQTISISGAEDAVAIFYYVQKGQNPAAWVEKKGPAHPDGPEQISISLDHTPYDASNPGGYSISQYRVSAYQTDRAENSSSPLATRTVSINDKFPDIDEISIEQANGIYSVGQTLTFKVALNDKVVLTPLSTGGFTIKSKISPSEGKITADIDESALRKPASGTNTTDLLHFGWVIPENILWLNGIEVDDNTINFSGLRDMYGNAGPGAVSDDSLDRDGIIVDSIPPRIGGFSPALSDDGKTGGAVLAPGDKLTLTFNENVWPESGGEITIRPYPISKWYLPAVLSEAEFNSVYRSALITEDDQKTLYYVNQLGVPLERGGSAFETYPPTNQEYSKESPRTNFYSLTTHGLKEDKTNQIQIPDLTSKYVLNYQFANYDANDYDGTWGGTNLGNDSDNSIAALRDVFNKAEYDWYRIDVNAQGIVEYGGTLPNSTRNKVLVTLPAELPAGRQWEVMIKAGSFRDIAGNLQAKVGWEGNADASQVWHFWSRGAATPTIRVNRVSYNGENPQPPSGAAVQTAPLNDTRVRIDSQTPGAVLSYGILNKDSMAPTPDDANYFDGGADIALAAGRNADAATADLTAISTVTGYTLPFYAGSGDANGNYNVNRYTARKDYVAATAAPGWTMPGWDADAMQNKAYEGVFRTVVMLKAPTGGTNNYILGWKISGSDKGWINGIAGFPFYEVENTSPYYGAQTYRVDYDGGNTNYNNESRFGFLWVSWEIVSDWEYRGMGRHWTNATTPQVTGDRMVENNASSTATDHTFATYGSLIYDVNRTFYGNGS